MGDVDGIASEDVPTLRNLLLDLGDSDPAACGIDTPPTDLHGGTSRGADVGVAVSTGAIIDFSVNEESESPQLQIPAGVHTVFKVYKAIPKYCVVIESGRALDSDDPSFLSEEERIAIELGFLPQHVPIWKTHYEGKKKSASGESVSRKKVKKAFEYIQTFECKCKGCKVMMKVLRVDGGLIGMAKCEMIHGTKVVIEHNTGAHHRFIGASNSKESALSVTQKSYIAKNYCDDGNPDLFIKNMLDNPLVPCSEKQETDGQAFKRSVYDFVQRNPKYFQGSSKNETMSLELVVEILDLLMQPLANRTGDAPTGASNDFYYTTSTWKNYMWKYIVILSHGFDKSTGEFNNILFAPVDAHERAKAAADTFPGRKVQLETDYFSVNKVGASWEVGHVGVSDYAHKYWPLVFQIARSDNEEAA